MSTILDALKKSEQERKLNNIPTLSDMPMPHEASRWPLTLLVSVVVLLLIILGLVVKQVWFPRSYNNELVNVPQAHVEAQLDVSNKPLTPEGVVVSVVSYSQTPSKRFIMIDGKLFRENEFVEAGLKVEEIRKNEVVLNFRGKAIVRRP